MRVTWLIRAGVLVVLVALAFCAFGKLGAAIVIGIAFLVWLSIFISRTA